jgi:hypothetical protein
MNTWKVVGLLNTARYLHTTTLLPDGNVLVAGGSNSGGYGNLNSAEVYDSGLGFDKDWRPTISSITSTLVLGDAVSITGTGFRGFQLSEASGGGTNSSATNYPLIQIRRLDNEQLLWISSSAFSATAITSAPVSSILAGPAIVTVFVNGIPSESVPLLVRLPYFNIYLPALKK